MATKADLPYSCIFCATATGFKDGDKAYCIDCYVKLRDSAHIHIGDGLPIKPNPINPNPIPYWPPIVFEPRQPLWEHNGQITCTTQPPTYYKSKVSENIGKTMTDYINNTGSNSGTIFIC